MNKLISAALAVSLLLTACPLRTAAAGEPKKADLEDAVYEQLLKQEEYNDGADGVVTEEELQQIDVLSLDMENVTSLDFLRKMPALKALWLTNGSISDLSAIQECSGLVTLGLQNLPNVNDISFVKDMHLTTFYLNLNQITDEQMLDVIRFQDAEIETGFSAVIGGLPNAMLATQDVSLKIDDAEIACSELQSGKPDESPYSAAPVYGLKEGETTYSVYYKDAVIHTGTIKVKARQQSDPALKSDITAPELVASSYYTQDQPLVLKNGTLSKPENGGLTVLEQDVVSVSSAGFYDDAGKYRGADITLHKDGTLFINGEVPEDAKDIKFKQINYKFCIAEDGRLFYLRDGQGKTVLDYVCSGIASCPEDNSIYVTSEDGEIILIRSISKKTNDSTEIQYAEYPTGIMNIICCKNDYFVDENGVLWYVDRRGAGAPSVKKKTADVTYVGYRHYNQNTYGCVYIKADGNAYQVENGSPVTLDFETEEPLDDLYYLNENVFRINGKGGAWSYEALFPCANYHITDDNVLTLQYEDKYAAITNVSKYFAATGDTLTGDIYAYFIRTDNTVWSYSFLNGEFRCIDDASEPEPPKPANDINGDGSFDKKDIILLQDWLLGKPDVKLNNPASADYDGNKRLDAADLSGMKRALAANTNA